MDTATVKRELVKIPLEKFVTDWIYRIDLDAEYQRDKIWDRERQEKLIDSVLNDIDIPKLYLVEVDGEQYNYECIDGKQRITSFLHFFKPDSDEKKPLEVKVAGRTYTYSKLKDELPAIAKFIDDYELHLTVLKKESVDDELVKEIFRRLQLGIQLNSGELLNSCSGQVRNFIYNELGKSAPFIANTSISGEMRFSKEYTLAQAFLNSYSKSTTGDFTRARKEDIQDFFFDYDSVPLNEHFQRFKNVLKKMDDAFGSNATHISSRAVVISAYLFIEELIITGKEEHISVFVEFYLKLLSAIREDMANLKKYTAPRNPVILDQFQKYILQASVEEPSIKRRHKFLSVAFDYYRKNNKILSAWNSGKT